MIKKIKNFLKVSTKEEVDPKILKKKIRNIFETFKKEKVNFCILRNYDFLEKQKDLDILIERGKDVRGIMKKFGFRKRTSYGPYTSYKRKDLWLDFKVGYLAYQAFRFEDASSILGRKRPYNYYYVPKEEDEFIHLVLHSILYKGYFKDKYKGKINSLLSKISEKDVIDRLDKKFPIYGKRLFYLIKNGKYDKALTFKWKLFPRLFDIRDFPSFCIMKAVEFYGRMYRSFV